jgi:4-hydroxythreonine-4-phosphate dehydrogenase
MSSALPIAVTLGDPCGIGPEIILKAALARSLNSTRFVVYGDLHVLKRAARQLACPLHVVGAPDLDTALARAHSDESNAPSRVLPVIECSSLADDVPLGRVNARAGLAALNAIHRACDDALTHRVSALVTAPIHKEAMALAGMKHPGHTELLAERARVREVRMMLVNNELRTVLVTLHEPLQQALANLSVQRVLDTILLAQQGLEQLGLSQGRIAVAGVNPHAGENGLLGREEEALIKPAIAMAQARGLQVSGPWPGDTVFMRARGFKDFDLVVAMYHDQGLIPLKYLGLDTGVNITLGLPFIRTSVDHGTAFDIVGQNRADPASLLAALHHAESLQRGRNVS